jgi:hypothetical protein
VRDVSLPSTEVAMKTVPGATPSCGSPPITPLVATATSAESSDATPAAICSAAASFRTDAVVTPRSERFTGTW